MNHDLTAELSRLTTTAPATLLPGVMVATGLADGFVTRDSPLGTLMVVFDQEGVTGVELFDDQAPARHANQTGREVMSIKKEPEWLARHLDLAIASGRPGRLPIHFRDLTDFQRSVLTATASIPTGEVRPYGWIAREIGNEGAVRAVGSALAANPVPVIVPCHRVVRSDGTLGRYSLGHDENKEVLLEAEGLDVEHLQTLARRGVRFLGTRSTGIFCHPTCGHSQRVGDEGLEPFRSEAAARDAGYRPCRMCRPAAA